tara:strand:+ start:387 stop:809 length:423 start_codon:yes stop_codon:yes gene_type:complete
MSSKSSAIFDELFLSVERLGVEGTIRQLRKTNSISQNTLDSFILEMVCSEFSLKKQDLTKSEDKDPDKRDARLILAHLLYQHTNLSQSKVGLFMNRTKGAISRYVTEVAQLNPKIKQHKDLIVKLDRLENEVEILKNKIH